MKTKTRKRIEETEPYQFPTSTIKHLQRCQLEDGGNVVARTKEIVDMILNAFQTPEMWPCEDVERIALLKALYRKATDLRRLERLSA